LPLAGKFFQSIGVVSTDTEKRFSARISDGALQMLCRYGKPRVAKGATLFSRFKALNLSKILDLNLLAD